MNWPCFEFEGKTYDFSYLEEKTVSYLQAAQGTNPPRGYRVDVSYSHHCFTRSIGDENPTPDMIYRGHPDDLRIFDVARFRLSNRLPAITKNLMSRTCFKTNQDNFLTVEIVNKEQTLEYEIYFKAYKPRAKPTSISLVVQSAYVRDVTHLKDRPQKKVISFASILYDAK